MAESKHLIGRVCVESGRVLILDPSFLEPIYVDHLKKAIGTLKDEVTAASLAFPNGLAFAVVSKTAVGDGYFPVYLETKNGCAARLVIDFLSETEAPSEPLDEQGTAINSAADIVLDGPRVASAAPKIMTARELLAVIRSDHELRQDMKIILGPTWESQLDRPVRVEFAEGRSGKYREAVFRWNDVEY